MQEEGAKLRAGGGWTATLPPRRVRVSEPKGRTRKKNLNGGGMSQTAKKGFNTRDQVTTAKRRDGVCKTSARTVGKNRERRRAAQQFEGGTATDWGGERTLGIPDPSEEEHAVGR